MGAGPSYERGGQGRPHWERKEEGGVAGATSTVGRGTASTEPPSGQHEALQGLAVWGPWGHKPLLIHPVTMQQGLLRTYYVPSASALGVGLGHGR